jgi:hypothetical protein
LPIFKLNCWDVCCWRFCCFLSQDRWYIFFSWT